jgi:threonine dehydrogenase-like Zn-dependent dehydrogenase
MRALVKREAAPGLWLEEVPVPEIGINDVLIKIVRTAICGTDVHIFNWDAWAAGRIRAALSRAASRGMRFIVFSSGLIGHVGQATVIGRKRQAIYSMSRHGIF